MRNDGLTVDVNNAFYGFCIEADVCDGAARTKIEWTEADAYRFFPAQEDDAFGWTVHRADQAISKLVAAAARRTARDAVDVLLLDTFYCPMEVCALAAPAKLGDVAPTRILQRVLENAIAHQMQDYEALDLDRDAMPFEIGKIKMILAERIAEAQRVIVDECGSAEVGKVYTRQGRSRIVVPYAREIASLTAISISEQSAIPIIGPRTITPAGLKSSDPYERS